MRIVKMVGQKILIVHLVFLLPICLGDKLDITFYLFTPANPDVPINVTDIANAVDVVPSRPVKIICHGYEDHGLNAFVNEMARAYLNHGVSNVISIDWRKYSNIFYLFLVPKIPEVGENVAEFIMAMSQTFNIPLADFHLIGHSIGAHILGFAGKHMGDEKVSRITALDPAGPLYNAFGKDNRLDSSDADFVDAIHTSTFFLGYKDSIGHADFFPNGGVAQPGCDTISPCSHMKALAYFTESIGRTSFVARRCDSWEDFKRGDCDKNEIAVMGDECSSSTRGDYYLKLQL